MKRMAVLTSGGDAPGMNAAIRSVVRIGINAGWEVLGIQHGYAGLIADNVVPLGARAVSGIIQQGGTILGSARCPEFKTEAARLFALRVLRKHEIETVVIIGGNGSQIGAYALSQLDFPVIGVASTIDNDLYGSDITIGVDTALNIALEAIDRLKTTASSHQRAFLIEIMGRHCGYLALMAAIAGGAEAVLLPEVDTEPEALAKELHEAYLRGKPHALVVVAEGAKFVEDPQTQAGQPSVNPLKASLSPLATGDSGDHVIRRSGQAAETVASRLQLLVAQETFPLVVGLWARGGVPTAVDRQLGLGYGAGAIRALKAGKNGVMVAFVPPDIKFVPLTEAINKVRTVPVDSEFVKIAQSLGICLGREL